MGGRLQQKVAGLPAWAWGLIIGLLAVASMYWLRSRQAAVSATPATVPTTPQISDVGIPSSSGGGGQAVAPDSSFETNGMWTANSLAYLISQGVAPLTAQRALALYLDGQDLDPTEYAAVNLALAHNGPPPQGTSGTSQLEQPAPAPAPAPAPPKWPDTEKDPRRVAIIGAYRTYLGRDPGLLEVNYWDARRDLSTEQVVAAILAQPEAQNGRG